MKNELLKFGNVKLRDIEDEAVADWRTAGATHLRVQLPASSENVIEMQKRRYFWADRTLGVTINLMRPKLDYGKLVRMEVTERDDLKDDILRIAKNSFPDDRRFHILSECDEDIAALVLETWVREMSGALVCMYKERPVGFAELRETGGDGLFIHLAAVEEKYRQAGAAMSLYAKAAELAAKRGYKRLCGRISTANTPVANLYAFLGASFEKPCDIFLKEAAK